MIVNIKVYMGKVEKKEQERYFKIKDKTILFKQLHFLWAMIETDSNIVKNRLNSNTQGIIPLTAGWLNKIYPDKNQKTRIRKDLLDQDILKENMVEYTDNKNRLVKAEVFFINPKYLWDIAKLAPAVPVKKENIKGLILLPIYTFLFSSSYAQEPKFKEVMIESIKDDIKNQYDFGSQQEKMSEEIAASIFQLLSKNYGGKGAKEV